MSERFSRVMLASAPAAPAVASIRDASLRPLVDITHSPDRAPLHLRILRHGSLELDLDCCQVTVDGHPVDATAHHLRLLEYLMRRPGRVFRREELLRALCGMYADDRAPEGINSHVCRLRKALGPAGHLIETVRCIGYRLRA